MLLIVSAVGTGTPVSSTADNTFSFKSQDTLVFSYLVAHIYHKIS